MKTILISIISDQTIPNLLLILELKDKYSGQIFITTPKMEKTGKSCWIEKAAGILPNSVPRIEVNENSWDDIKMKLENYNWPENSVFLVNLTGGTKVMSLAIFNYFAQNGNQVVYVPIGKNIYEELYPRYRKIPLAVDTRLSVWQYLTAYGVIFEKKVECKKPFTELATIYKKYKSNGYDINKLNEGYSPEWKNYFTGEWFEEYLFYRIKKELQLNDGFIEMSVALMQFNEARTMGNDQELDIVFTHNNELYICEAKVSLGKERLKKEVLHPVMFKLSAVNKNFGLRSYASIITLANIGDRSETFRRDLQRKMKVLGIHSVIDRPKVTDPDFTFNQLLQEK